MLCNVFWSKDITIDEVRKGAENSALVVGVFTLKGIQIVY